VKIKTAKPPLSIERRIAALHQEMERAIREYIAEIAPYYPGVTRDVIRHCELTARAGGCLCKAYTTLADRKRLG